MKQFFYVLLTAAKNEEKFIRQTIESVISQRTLPLKWVIVSDASTDRTDDIIKEYESKYSFIKLVRATGQAKRNFASKAFALNIGYEYLKDINYDFIGILDADVTFNPSYYETILNKLLSDQKLGIAGGVLYDFYNDKFHKITQRYHSVAGPIQLFRRKCYEDIGLWIPLPSIDAYAEIAARQHGWKVMSFDDEEVLHHRLTGTATANLIRHRFWLGRSEYSLGYSPLFQALKCIGRLNERPFIIGAILRFSGFWWAAIKKERKNIPKDFSDYIRKEQRQRVRNIFTFRKKFL